ncbi:MAG: beta-lactamase family protein, partial [Firmicutes bacterium]|nr:beta-lactamase family protein [Bacillota bacterium]
ALYPEKLLMEENTLFDLASLTKIISTTMVALALIEAEKLSPDDTLDKFFNLPDDKRQITIRHLMTHVSGLAAHIPLYNLAKSPVDVYDVILSQPLQTQPGTNVVYSCLGFILLGKICEMVGDAGLDELASRFVFRPLGLKNIGYNPAAMSSTFAATEYCPELQEWLCGTVHDENARFMGGVSGNAGLFADIGDCAAVATMFANKGKGVISQYLFEEAIKNHTAHFDEGRGLGFAVKNEPNLYGHTGFTGTSIWVNAETGLYVVFLTNRVHPTRDDNRLTAFRDVLTHKILEENFYAHKNRH